MRVFSDFVSATAEIRSLLPRLLASNALAENVVLSPPSGLIVMMRVDHYG